MRYSTQIKPIRYVKAHAAELLNHIADGRRDIPSLLTRRILEV
jgi:hypothetical protein